MYDVGNCLFVYNLYVDSYNQSSSAIWELEAARAEIEQAMCAFDTNFVIDGYNADNNAISAIRDRINRQIDRIRNLQSLYGKSMDDMQGEMEAHGDW